MSNWWFTLQPFLLPLIKLLPGSNNWVPYRPPIRPHHEHMNTI